MTNSSLLKISNQISLSSIKSKGNKINYLEDYDFQMSVSITYIVFGIDYGPNTLLHIF